MAAGITVAVVGAGLAGLTAAHALAGQGARVTVFDKSRGLGGRLATRRRGDVRLDHGAPWVHARGADFRAALADWPTAAPFGAERWVGLPGMTDLARPLAEGLEVRREARVVGVDGRCLRLEDGAAGPFDCIVVAVPAPQAAELLGHPDALDAVEMIPVWTLLAAFDAPLAASVPDGVSGEVADLIVRNAAKPGRQGPDGWLLHARPGWSRANLERTREEVADLLAAELQRALGRPLPRPVYLAAHRWRYARTARPLGRPFLSLDEGRVLAGGDWTLGPDAEHAWESGRAMAEALVR